MAKELGFQGGCVSDGIPQLISVQLNGENLILVESQIPFPDIFHLPGNGQGAENHEDEDDELAYHQPLASQDRSEREHFNSL